MLSKKDFILLKMVFDETLYLAVQDQDLERVINRLEAHYAYELANGFVGGESLSAADLAEIKQINEEESKNDAFSWAM